MSFLDKIKSWFGGSYAPAAKEPPAKKEEPAPAEAAPAEDKPEGAVPPESAE